MTKKTIGLGSTPPTEECSSKKCPWHGGLKVRGRVFRGVVKASKAQQTAVISWDYYQHLHRYERYERRKSSIIAHNPDCISAKAGDTVAIGECRPISKAKRFVIFEKVKSGDKK